MNLRPSEASHTNASYSPGQISISGAGPLRLAKLGSGSVWGSYVLPDQVRTNTKTSLDRYAIMEAWHLYMPNCWPYQHANQVLDQAANADCTLPWMDTSAAWYIA